VFYEGKMYNGYDAALVTSSGTSKNSIDKTKDRIVGEACLLDVARWKGVRALEPGYAITAADLDATAAAERVEIRRGDIVIVRTGHMSRYLDRKDWRHFDLDDSPGVSVHTAPWMHAPRDRRDRGRQLRGRGPPLGAAAVPQPVSHLRDPQHGVDPRRDLLPRGARGDCAGGRALRVLLVAPPLPVTRGVGTPINPYAIK
jgi:hypothetical protein